MRAQVFSITFVVDAVTNPGITAYVYGVHLEAKLESNELLWRDRRSSAVPLHKYLLTVP